LFAGDIFWLRELMVFPKATNQGIGKLLHDETVDGRPESPVYEPMLLRPGRLG